jgi:hydrogenase-4 component H
MPARTADMPFDVLTRIIGPLRRGVLSSRYPAAPPLLAPGVRGLPELDAERCSREAACVAVCPTDAITLGEMVWSIDAGRCVFCGACALACPTDAIRLGPGVELASRERPDLVVATALRSRE